MASGPDAPAAFPGRRQGIATMLLREAKTSGPVSGPEQRITLETGKVADLCLLGGGLLRADPDDTAARRPRAVLRHGH